MTDDDFNAVFGDRVAPRTSFVERIRAETPKPVVHPKPADGMSAETAAAITALADVGEYRAYGHIPHGQLNPSCEVRSWMDGTDVPDGTVFFYRLLMQIGFTGNDELRLMLPDSIIVVTGKNLDPVRQSLTRQQATFLQQHSRKVWPRVAASDEPLIERIEILRS